MQLVLDLGIKRDGNAEELSLMCIYILYTI